MRASRGCLHGAGSGSGRHANISKHIACGVMQLMRHSSWCRSFFSILCWFLVLHTVSGWVSE